MIDYTFNAEEKVLYITYKDTITFAEFPPFFEELAELKNTGVLPRVLLIMSDYTSAHIEMSPDDLPKMFMMMQQHFDAFDNIYEAFIHVNPFETALSVIAREHASQQSTYVSEVFSSSEMALAWLKKH